MPTTKTREKRATPIQRVAVERMWRLFELAQKAWKKNPLRTRRYITLIQGFSTRFRTPIPAEIKKSFCKHCKNYWVEGENVKRRIHGKTITTNCLICGKLTRRKMEEEKNA